METKSHKCMKVSDKKRLNRGKKHIDTLLKIKKMIEITIILCINFQRNWSKEMNEKSSIAFNMVLVFNSYVEHSSERWKGQNIAQIRNGKKRLIKL